MHIESILSDIQKNGFSIQNNIFHDDDISSLYSDIINAYHNNSSSNILLKAAGVGKEAQLNSNIRGDKIHWLTKENLTSSQKKIWDFLETLKYHLNQNFFLNIKEFETHLTIYPSGTFYKKHIDQFRFSGNEPLSGKIRKISFVIYLNQDWSESDGGELVLFDSKDQEKIVTKILPQFGRAVFFLSEELPHEVLTTNKERASMTGWFF